MRTDRLLLPALCAAGLAANIAGRTVDPLVSLVSFEFSIGVATAALVTSAYALPFALGQPLLGPLGDIYGRIRLLKISVWILTLALLASAFAPSFEALAAARFLAGLAAGGVVPACMATIGDAYPPERRQFAISIFVSMGLLAQIFAASGSGIVGEALGWRYVLFATGIFGLVGAVMATAILRSPEREHQKFSLAAAAANYRRVFRNPKALLCYSTVFLEGVALYGIFPYVAEILRQQNRGGATEAGIIIGAIGIGGIFYVASVAVLFRRFNRYQFMAVGGVLMTIGPLVLAFAPPWPLSAGAFAVGGFGFMLLHNSIQTETIDLAPEARQSAYSLHALSFFTGQAAGPPLFGLAFFSFGAGTALIASAIILAGTGLVMSKLFRRASERHPV
jgi:predicted MFS family arabinose efflux permease